MLIDEVGDDITLGARRVTTSGLKSILFDRPWYSVQIPIKVNLFILTYDACQHCKRVALIEGKDHTSLLG